MTNQSPMGDGREPRVGGRGAAIAQRAAAYLSSAVFESRSSEEGRLCCRKEEISRACKFGSHSVRIGILLAVVVLARSAPAWASGTVASAVLGQQDFTHSAPNIVDAASINSYYYYYYYAQGALAVDKSSTPNHLYVADGGNSRVLGYASIAALMNGAPADLVIGQPDFFADSCNTSPINGAANLCRPGGVAVDSNGNLYVADTSNNRVLVFSNPFVIKTNTGRTAGFAAFMVLGQAGDFTSTECNVGGSQPSASTLCAPSGVALDNASNLYVADVSNNRVLEFNNPAGTGSLSADMVVGQASFTNNLANRGGSPSRTTLNAPVAVAVDSNSNLYVADDSNNRVLFYTTPLTTDTSADQVWGQGGSFTLNSCNTGGGSATTLCNPAGVALDGSNNLYIADFSNSRVLEYNETTNPPGNRTANLAFGQLNTTAFNGCNAGGSPASNTLCDPFGIALDSSNDLFVFDGGNNRVLEYFTPLTSSGGGTGDTTADVVLGQADFAHNSANSVDAISFNYPIQAALDKSATPNRLYLADYNNHRVLGWGNATSFTNGAPADLVIGQPDFQLANCNGGVGVSGTSLCYPTGVAVDANGNLYVADYYNSRVLEFTNPFASCGSFPCIFGGSANKVFGQANANSNSCNSGGISATSLCSPQGVALDGVGNLYIADYSNNRVLEYNTPLKSTSVTGSGDTTADLVFGQGTTGKGTEFTTNDCNHAGLSDHSLCNPTNGVATDSSNNVYVADFSNNRVLEFNEPTNATTAPNNVVAGTVFGQFGNFTVNTCNNTALSADSLCAPTGLSLDSANNLFVADGYGNSRVLEYFTPLTLTATSGSGDTTADIVWGQGGSFVSSYCNLYGASPSAATLCRAEAVVVDGSGRVFISDHDNNRLLLFNPPFTPPGFAMVRALAAAPAGVISVHPARLTFVRAVAVGRLSQPQRLTITNEGDTPVKLRDIRTSSGEFVVGGTCGGVLPAGVSCTVTVTFKPLTTGWRGGQLIISNSARNSPHAIRLKGHAGQQERLPMR